MTLYAGQVRHFGKSESISLVWPRGALVLVGIGCFPCRNSTMVSLTLLPPEVHRRASRIEILGVFGSGKSTFAAKLASASDLQYLPEDHTKNPFWGQEEALKVTGYLPYDLSFMVQHAYLAANNLQDKASASICDWSFLTDRLWALTRLEHDIRIYDAAQNAVLNRVGAASGYLYLKQPTDLIIKRIRERNRKPEAKFYKFIERAVSAVDLLAIDIPQEMLQVVGDDDVDLALRSIEGWVRKSGAND